VLRRQQGLHLHRLNGTFSLKRSDKEVSQAANHIGDALRKTANIYPVKGKSIPSNLTRG